MDQSYVAKNNQAKIAMHLINHFSDLVAALCFWVKSQTARSILASSDMRAHFRLEVLGSKASFLDESKGFNSCQM